MLWSSSIGLSLHRVEGVSQRVAQEVHAQDNEGDDDPREVEEPGPSGSRRLPESDQQPERSIRRGDAEPKVREARLSEDRAADAECGADDDGPDRVRNDVRRHDSARPRPDRPGSLDELLLDRKSVV
jgi:hypothetical protein